MFCKRFYVSLIILISALFVFSCAVASKKITHGNKKATTVVKSNFILDVLKHEQQFNGQVLAKIGNRQITTGKFEQLLQSGKSKKGKEITYDKKKELLEEMVDNEIMLIAALKSGLDQNQEIIDKANKKLRDLAINWMFKHYVTDKITISEKEVSERLLSGKKNNETIEKAKKRISREIFNKKKRFLDNIWTAQCYKDVNVSYNKENLNFFVRKWSKTKARVRQNNPRFSFIQNKDAFKLNNSELNKVIAVFDSGEITVSDVLNALNDIIPTRRPAPSLNAAKKLTEYALIRPVLGKKAFNENWHKAKEIRKVLADWLKGQLIVKVQSVKVWNKIQNSKITEDDRNEFYKKNKQRYTYKDKDGNKKTISYEKLKNSIESDMKETLAKKAMENWKKKLKNNIKIEINEELLIDPESVRKSR